METSPTAGDLIRQALMDGDGKRTLARKLAGPEGGLVEIERWRAVIVRAERGGEPNETQATRISESFGVAVRPPERTAKGAAAAERLRRLEEVEEALNALGPELARLADRVEALELLARPRRKPGGSSSGGQE